MKIRTHMKMQRFRWIMSLLLAAAATATGIELVFAPRSAAQSAVVSCQPVNTQLDGSLYLCSESPVGFCAVGTVSSGLLKGSKSAVYNGVSFSAGLPNVEPASTSSYSGTQVFHTDKGDLHMSVVGVSDTARQVFTEVARITGGTGWFSNATGNLFISGTLTPDGIGFQSKVTGEVCFDRAQ